VVLIWRRRLSTINFIENLYASWQAALPIYRHSLPVLTAELERARRYRHKLSVVILSTHHEQHDKSRLALTRAAKPEEPASPFFSLINSLMRDNLRHSDIVTYDVKNDHYVLLFPESSAVATQQAILRITGLVLHRTGTRLRHGIAEFPSDGLILQDLIGHAYARMCRTVGDGKLPQETAEKEPEARPSVVQVQ